MSDQNPPPALTAAEVEALSYEQMRAMCARCLGCGMDYGCPRCGRVHRLTVRSNLSNAAKAYRRAREGMYER